jgi:hypothetical protein
MSEIFFTLRAVFSDVKRTRLAIGLALLVGGFVLALYPYPVNPNYSFYGYFVVVGFLATITGL